MCVVSQSLSTFRQETKVLRTVCMNFGCPRTQQPKRGLKKSEMGTLHHSNFISFLVTERTTRVVSRIQREVSTTMPVKPIFFFHVMLFIFDEENEQSTKL